MDWLERLDQYHFLGNSAGSWTIAVLVAVGSLLVLRALLPLVSRRIRAISAKTSTRFDDLISQLIDQVKSWFLLVLAIWLGSLCLPNLPVRYVQVLRSIASVAFIVQGALWASVLLVFSIRHFVSQRVDTDAATATSITAIGFLAKLVLWAIVVVLVLQNLGIEVAPLIAGLGVGGIALALASQHILGDLFASFVILLDKPFVIGDFIVVGGDFSGTIEYVGLKTTRVRSLSGEQVVVANTDLLKSRVRNYKRMLERRVVFKLGVTYRTPHEKIAAIPGILRSIVESQRDIRFDRAHFFAYGDFALIFEVVYYVLSSDYARYMDIQQAINLEIHRRFEAEKIAFAHPTQTVFLEQPKSEIVEK